MFKKVHSKLIFLIVIVSIIFISGMHISRTIMSYKIDELFTIRTIEKNDLFDRLISLQGKSLEMFAYDYTFWDDMVNFVSKPDDKWAVENIDNVVQNFNVQFVWIYNPSFDLIYSIKPNHKNKRTPTLFSKEELSRIFDIQYFNHFFINTDYGIIELRTAPIQPSSDFERKTSPQGYFISGRLWDSDYLEKLSKLVESRVTIIPADNPDTLSHEDKKNSIVIKKVLSSWDNKPVVELDADSGSDVIIERLEDSKKIEFVISIVFVLFLIIALYTFTYIWIGSPLNMLSTALKKEDSIYVKQLQKDKAEFGTLAKLINRFLDQKKELVNEINEHIKTKELLEKITFTSPALITVFDIESEKNIYQNRSILEDLGYPADKIPEMLKKFQEQGIEMVNSEDIHVLDKFYNELPDLEDNVSYDMEYRLRDYHGNWQWIRRIYSVFHRDENGYPSRIVSIFENINKRKTNEKILRESEEKFRMLTETVPAMILIYQDSKIVYVNQYARTITGISIEELTGANIWEMGHEDIQEDIKKITTARLNSNNAPTRYEFKFKTKSGIIKWLDVSACTIEYQGKIAALVTSYEITKRKTAEIILENSRNFYLSLFDNLPTLISRTGVDMKCDYFNKTWLDFRGVTLEEELETGWSSGIHPDDIERCGKVFYSAFDKRDSFKNEYRLKHHSGEYHWMVDIGRPYYDINGQFGGYIGTSFDINDEKKLESSLKISEEYYRNLFESAHDAIIIFRPDNEVILDVNDQACKIYGFTKDEMIGMSLISVSENIEHGKSLINETLDKSFVQNLNTVHRTKKGSIMFIESNAAVINYKGENAILAINRDITAKKLAEDQILASLKEKEILIKEVHHRVKNNLQIISSLLKLQSEHIKDKDDVELFRESQSRVKSMALIHEKLYRSRDLSRIDFGDYIQNLTSTLLFTYGISPRKIRLNLRTEKVFFDVDTAIPCGLLVNELVSNIIKHAFGKDESGEITVEVISLGEGMYKLIVQDNGRGIPDDIDYKNTKTLGMQLVVTLSEQLDASIELDKCGGTKFTITFKELKYKER